MKKLLAVLVVFVALGISVPVGAEEAGIGLTFNPRIWDGYLFSNGFKAHHDPVLHTNLTFGLPQDFWVDIFHSMGLDGTSPNTDLGDELDLTAGWGGAKEKISFSLGVSYFALYNLERMKDDAMQLFGEVGYTWDGVKGHKFAPYTRLEYTFPVKKGALPPGGLLGKFGVTHTWQLASWVELANRPAIHYDEGAFGFQEAALFNWRGGLNWKIAKNAIIELPALMYSTPLTRLREPDPRKSEMVIGMGLTFRF